MAHLPSSNTDGDESGFESCFESVSTMNLYNPSSENDIVEAVLDHINQLGAGEGDLPPFISLTKLKPGRIYTIRKIIKHLKGVDNAPVSGIQLYLDVSNWLFFSFFYKSNFIFLKICDFFICLVS